LSDKAREPTDFDDLLTDVDLTTGDVIERFTRILSQRNALLRNSKVSVRRPCNRVNSKSGRATFAASATNWSRCEKVARRCRAARRELLPRTRRRRFDRRVTYDNRGVATSSARCARRRRRPYRSHHDRTATRRLALTLDGRDTRRQASQGEQRSLAWRYVSPERISSKPTRRRSTSVVGRVFSELDPHRSDRLLNLLQQVKRS